MFVRRKVLAGAAVVAAVSAAVALPGAAQAAQPAKAAAVKAAVTKAAVTKAAVTKGVLVMTLGRVQAGPLMPGGRAKVFDLSVTNTSGRAVAFGSELGGGAHGALGVGDREVKLSMTPVHAPATTLSFGGQDGGLLGSFFPKGKEWGSSFTLPAHATYTWKVTLAAGKTWPVNDDRLLLGFNVGTSGGREVASRELNLKVGTARTGGPIVQTLTGGDTLSAAKPLVLRYTLTNRTGAAVAAPLGPGLLTTSSGTVPLTAQLAYDVWQHGRWVPIGEYGGQLAPTPAHWRNGASVSYLVRVRLVGWDAGAGATDRLVVEASYDPFEASADRTVTVTR